MILRRPVWPWYAGALSLLVVDQVSKALVRQYMALHQSIPLIGEDFLRLTYVLNPGIAFGVRILGLRPLLVFGWLATIALAYYLYRLARRGDVLRWPVMLFLAGAMGNSIDRLLFGEVTDFVDVDFPDIIMTRWPVFNVADSCVTIGIALLFYFALFRRETAPTPPATDSHASISAEPDSLSADDRPGTGTAAD